MGGAVGFGHRSADRPGAREIGSRDHAVALLDAPQCPSGEMDVTEV
jgi:hypothetical protein